jgi:hypothetical protein
MLVPFQLIIFDIVYHLFYISFLPNFLSFDSVPNPANAATIK